MLQLKNYIRFIFNLSNSYQSGMFFTGLKFLLVFVLAVQADSDDDEVANACKNRDPLRKTLVIEDNTWQVCDDGKLVKKFCFESFTNGTYRCYNFTKVADEFYEEYTERNFFFGNREEVKGLFNDPVWNKDVKCYEALTTTRNRADWVKKRMNKIKSANCFKTSPADLKSTEALCKQNEFNKVYIFQDGQWYTCNSTKKLVKLTEPNEATIPTDTARPTVVVPDVHENKESEELSGEKTKESSAETSVSEDSEEYGDGEGEEEGEEEDEEEEEDKSIETTTEGSKEGDISDEDPDPDELDSDESGSEEKVPVKDVRFVDQNGVGDTKKCKSYETVENIWYCVEAAFLGEFQRQPQKCILQHESEKVPQSRCLSFSNIREMFINAQFFNLDKNKLNELSNDEGSNNGYKTLAKYIENVQSKRNYEPKKLFAKLVKHHKLKNAGQKKTVLMFDAEISPERLCEITKETHLPFKKKFIDEYITECEENQ